MRRAAFRARRSRLVGLVVVLFRRCFPFALSSCALISPCCLFFVVSKILMYGCCEQCKPA
ncbi:hypothetical protein BDZ89DRAFT_1084475, partial [Hymenopellis radicata]